MANSKPRGLKFWEITWFTIATTILTHLQTRAEQSQGAYFLPEFALSPQGSFLEDTTGEQFLTYRYDDQTSRSTQSDEDKEGGWDAWGAWSDCSRTCGGGASYSLRRCLNGRNCEGRNIRYKTCSNSDCPSEAGDFRAQQCSAYNDVKYQGHFYEWIPVYDDSSSPCALKCQALGKALVVELAPKVLDGTRCNAKSLDMCISGICQAIGCDRQLGSHAKEDNCGICAGDGSSCRLVRGQAKTHMSPEKREETVIAVPHGSRSARITVKGPAHLVIESKTLQGDSGEHNFGAPGTFVIENTTVEFQKGSDRETIKIQGPLGADFIIKTRYTAPKDSLVQFFFYQPISHQWRQTEFFPCTVTCGGGYQLNSAECVDIRSKRVVPDQYCHYYPENKKPKPKLKECNMDPCPSSDGFKEIMPYDHFQPLPRWEHNPWTACSVSCGGGIQRRSFVCVEETMHGEILQVEEWKCMYAPKPKIMQACNLYDCPKWVALEWSQCTVTCGRGLRYRVVLCIDHRGQHTGGCNPQLKLHIKEECIVAVPCYKPREKNPVEARLPWFKQAHEMEETRTVSEEPTFIPEPWSPCSASCGHGVQVREVKCRIYLAFTQTEMELPDEECEESKPPTERSCHLESCDGDSVPYSSEFSHTEDADVIYDWEYIGFTPCSATCIGGTQEAIAVCLHEQTKQTVNDTLCDSTKRPPAMSRACNTRLCPPRWQVGPWRQCSATCGVGIQTREVHCQQPGGSIVTSENCKDKKPHTLQACNQIDCPPVWHVEEWQQCSHTCGGGTQNRNVTCRQLLMDGSFLKLADEKCHEPRLSTHKPCAKLDCLPELIVGEWSKCSVSCGVGTQRRNSACQKITAKGQQVALNGTVCNGLPIPPLVRPCHMNACNKMKQEIKPKLLGKYASHGPQILSIHRVYIQTRQEKRINFTIGSRAYLLPKTSVIIKCPVRRFQKSLIQWEKDGQRLQISKRLGVTKSGSLKVHSLEASDIGVYKCIAGSAQETFVLKLIGTDNRLIEPPTFRKHMGESSSAEHNEANSFGAKWHKMSQMWQLWNQKSKQYLGDRQVNHHPFLRHLETHRRNSAEGYSSREFKNKRLEAVVLPGAYSMDTVHFEELIKNLSHLVEAGEVNDDLASELVYQLIAELSKPSQSASEKLKEPQGERLSPRKPGKSPDVSDNLSAKPQNNISHKSPVIVRQKEGPKVYSNKTVTVRIGSAVFLTKDTRVINLLCEAGGGVNDLKYTWTKDGMELKSFEKVILEAGGNVQIRNPTRNEMGLYCCMVENDFGSDVGTSTLLYAEAPTILSSVINTTHLELRNLSVAVGGTVLVRAGANITLECPVQGLPQPDVSWFKSEGSSRNHSFTVQNGSLVLRNVSRENAGTYICTATNALGKAISATVLQLAERRFQEPNNGSSSNSRRKRVFMASGIGTNVSVVPGDLLRIGCPVHPSTKNTIRWFFKHQPIEEMEGFDHRILVGGRILEVNVTSSQFAGRYGCWASSSVKALSVWVNVKKEEYRWELGEWNPCSDTCGNLGTQFRRLQCVNVQEQKVNKSFCKESRRPVVRYRPCNIHDCPARWATNAWSECSTSCGQGFRQRQSVCKQVKANGTAVTLSPGACAHKERPLEQKPCVGHLCTEWIIHPWGQCVGRCIGHTVGLQHRLVQCRHQNGSAVSSSHCDDRKRPSMRRNCSSEKCDVYWRTGPWRPCTVDCGSGFQSRQVDCIHRRNRRPVADQHCAWRKRPVTWQHCNVTSCDKGECKDTTHYCTFVKHLKLCLIDLYKQRCCQSCGESYSSVGSS